MIRFIKIASMLFALLIPTVVFSQSDISNSDLVEKILESVADENAQNRDYTNLLDAVELLINNPVDMNKATAEDLQRIYLFNDYQIKSLLKYRKNNGAFLSIYELQLVPGFSTEFIQTIAPLICVNPNLSAVETTYRHHLMLLKTEVNLQKEKGYNVDSDSSRYLGNPWKYYARYQHDANNKIQFGFTAEKDKGEPFFASENSKGFDYYSAHLQLNKIAFFQQINVGDYQVKFGQGLSLWSGMRQGKSSFTTQNRRKQQGVTAYKSTNENLFFRGISTVIKPIKKGELTLFASSKKIDAAVDTSTHFISGIVNTGLHRNLKEFDKKHQIKEQALGGYFAMNTKIIKAGLSFVYYKYSSPLEDKKQAYAYYNFKGTNNYNISLNYKTNFKNMTLFGEVARSKSGGLAFLQGVNLQLHAQIFLEGIYRNYAKNYHARYAAAFGERGENRNERGFYFGTTIYPFPKWSVKAYYDLYEFPWLTYNASAPINGHDYFAQIDFTPNNKFNIYFRYKQENKPENTGVHFTKSPVDMQKNQYRLHFDIKPAPNWQLRNRMEFSYYKKQQKKENGFLIYQDIVYQLSNLPLRIGMRYAIFDTDSYNSRIYAYENDVLYGYSIPAYYDKGTRFYVNLKYQVHRKIAFYLRYAQTKYANKKSMGSGLSAIDGNIKSDIKLLLKVTL